MQLSKWALAVPLALAASASFGQIQVFGGGQGQGITIGSFGPGPETVSHPDMLLMRQDVQTDLGITSDQRKQLEDAQDGMFSGVSFGTAGDNAVVVQGGPPSSGGTAGAPDFKAIQKKIEDQVDHILTPPQKSRLKEIAIQLAGNAAVLDAGVENGLGLGEQQRAKVKDLDSKERAANGAVFEKARAGDLQPDQVMQIIRKNGQTLNTELGKILTDSQKAKLRAMGGKPFKAADDSEPGG